MKKEEFLRRMSDVDASFVADAAPEATRNTERETRGGRRLRWALTAAACLVILAATSVGLLLWKNQPEEPAIPQGDVYYPAWTDTREHKPIDSISEMAIEIAWEWEDCAEYEKWRVLTYGGREYESRASVYMGYTALPDASLVSKKLGSGTLAGWDNMSGEKHTAVGTVYEIAGVSPDALVAVQPKGSEHFYVYLCRDISMPKTLRELILRFGLTDTLPLTTAYSYKKWESGIPSVVYTLTSEDSDHLWALLSESGEASISDAAAPDAVELPSGESNLTFLVNAPALGVRNKAFTLYQSGTLFTNLAEYGYRCEVGSDVADRVFSYVLSNGKKTGYEAAQTVRTLTGTVTAIDDIGVTIDDSVSCVDPSEGKIFLLPLTEPLVERLVRHRMLRTGMLVMVTYDGVIEARDPLIVTAVTDISKAVLAGNGDVSIPE